MNEQPFDRDDELDFLAFQYVGDELTEDARHAFETRLLNDQAAREAVAGAVEVTLATREAFAEDEVLVAVRDDMRSGKARGWWSVALATCALSGLVLLSWSMQAGKRPATPGVGSDLAIAWSEARSEWPTSALTDEQLPEEPVPLTDDNELALPTWLIAAVTEANTEVSETSPGDTIPE